MKLASRACLRLFVVALFVVLGAVPGRSEAMLQYFNTSWNEITARMPELAEAGYDSIWVPPPTKAGGGLSVGYDLFDPFDLGSKDQRGSVSTFYGTEADLLRMVETAHRFGIRVYLDNVMNHRGFDVPGYNASTPIDLYPGLLPEDFHLRVTADGFYRNWPGISNYDDQFQVWNLSTSDLVDLAQEPGTTNVNFGTNQGDTHLKIRFIRHPNNPEYYEYKPDGTYVGFGSNNGLTKEILAANPNFYGEYVQDYLSRAARWEIDRTKADGLRLDAVKHLRDDFFGAEYGSDKNSSTYGYLGQVSQQFKLTRGFSDTNFRDTVFNTELPRDDAMFFGEHLGGTPQQPYIDAGMRLLDNALSSTLNGVLSYGPLNGLDQPGGGGLSGGPGVEVGYAQSADNGYANKRQLQHAFLLTRAGLPVIYTDGNHQAGTLGQIGKPFPANAFNNFLGQYSDGRLPNLLYIHNQFARGDQIPKWSDGSVVAYERRDKRENGSMNDADGTTLLFLMNGDSANGQSRAISTTFPAGSLLWQYATGAADGGDSMGGFYYTVPSNGQVNDLVVPKGGYFALSWRAPEMPDVNPGAPAISVLQDGQATPMLTYERKDGPDGDPAFNPYGVADAVKTDYKYSYTVPLVTSGANLSFLARADGSAENIQMELDGGVDINSQMKLGPQTGDLRDHPPALSTDVFLGYEQMQFVSRTAEKFAARDTSRDVLGSAGAETYQATVGTAGFTVINGSGYNNSTGTASYAYHDPTAQALDGQGGSTVQFYPMPQNAAGTAVTVWLKTGYQNQVNKAFLYYTVDGATYPEGAGGLPANAATTVVALAYQQHGNPDGSNVTDWWKGTLSALPSGTVLRYKIGAANTSAPSVFPSSLDAVALKKKMETRFQITGFNAKTASYHPHDDYGPSVTGLSEGFHVLRTRQFLNRQGRASIYNTSVQTFYYDTQPPTGQIAFPANDGDTLGGSSYGAVVRTDPSVTEVWYKILDGDTTNDDSATTANNGNGVWTQATQLTANPAVSSTYPNEWRFNYVNIPASGTARIAVRLRELTSSTMTAAEGSSDASTDAANHWTTLVRSVNTQGPNVRVFVAYPMSDGTVVDNNYVLKVWFSKSLADNTTTAQLLSRFLIKIASTASGSPANGVVQGQGKYSINYNVTNDYHELAYQLPNLYNGNPDFLHTIDVTYTLAGSPTLEAFRLVKARPVTAIKDNIVNPPEYDADGLPYQIVLPDVANPTAAQRSFNIRVETDSTATSVALNFTAGQGTTALNAGSPTVQGSSKFWDFTWSNIAAGSYTFTATVTTPSGNATASRNATVIFRQLVTPVAGKLDNDDDGLSDSIESTATPLPSTNSETWVNDDVLRYFASARSNPLSPDADGDSLSDGLELGLSKPLALSSQTPDTNTATDTNGDGTPNFQADLDPPIYNTTDNGSAPNGQDYSYYGAWPYNLNNARTDQIAGSTTDPKKADTEGDGLNDGVEDLTFLPKSGGGYQAIHNGRVDIVPVENSATAQTVIAHPPTVYNTSKVDRVKVLAKSPNALFLETDPNNADTDGDGSTDGSEDANHNGIVDLAIIDRNQTDAAGNFKVLATFTSPTQTVTVQGSATNAVSNKVSTRGKAAKAASAAPNATPAAVTFAYLDFCTRYVEPTDGKTYVSTALDKTRLNSTFRPNGQFRSDGLDVVWLETDPRRFSTSGDGLPDGWKISHGLDPFDDGVVGHYNLRTGKVITNTNNGPNGDPDGDGFTNLQEYLNGTDPTVSNTTAPPPPGSITVGPVPDAQAIVVGAVKNAKEFTDWTANDLVALSPYDGDGPNNGGSDVYHANDGYDSSRDLVAFYAHDGGDAAAGGDGNFYFRVDVADLKAYAEQGYLDIYVAINFGKPGNGERLLPDDVDTLTNMGWNAVVACYQTNQGRVYVDTDPLHNTTGFSQSLGDAQFGVVPRDQNAANGFKKSYYNADLDAVEFSVSRQALRDAGWNGLDAADLIYQVYTTKDGTSDNPPGPGNIGGRSDIRDCIYNDYIASDYYGDQASISGENSILRNWCGLKAGNDRGRKVKVVSLIHGNQAIQPGSYIQNLVNNNAGAGYYRPLDAHQAYGAPFAMHITPTLASALQWAAADPASGQTYRDGPTLNARVGTLANNGTLDLLGSTFSDHMLPYFDQSVNIANVALATEFLSGIYGTKPSSKVLWTPERVSDQGVLGKVSGLGFSYTFIDQMRHVLKWYGRSSALGSDGYRVNLINGTNCFVINDQASPYLFQNDDNGLLILLRQTLDQKARSREQDQVVVLVNNWEDFADKTKADAYDKNIRWLASHPWVQLTTPDAIANGQVDVSVPPDGKGDSFGIVDRGTNQTVPLVAQDFVDHATEESYDNWYNGSGLEESLAARKFSLRSGVTVPTPYGLQTSTTGAGGIVSAAWGKATDVSTTYGLARLARGIFHASLFETAFHNNANNDLSKFSTGAYIYPDTTFQTLADFSANSQAQTRNAAILARVDQWTRAAAAGQYLGGAVAEQADVDLDGENEYLLYNDRLFALFERIGGRMTAAWIRDIDTNQTFQVAGNFLSYSGTADETEGAANFVNGVQSAYRTSGFKDWSAQTGQVSTSQYVNDLYTATATTGGNPGWTFTSSDGKIGKTITLGALQSQLVANYRLSGIDTLFVRFGLSPNLADLILRGQAGLSGLVTQGGDVNLFENSSSGTVRAFVRCYDSTTYNCKYSTAATDRPDGATLSTVNLRNQAQTQQVEIYGGGVSMNFALGFQVGATNTYSTAYDGLPDWWKLRYGLNPTGPASVSGPAADPDGDGRTNLQEYLFGTNPLVADINAGGTLAQSRDAQGRINLTFPTVRNRLYRVLSSDNLVTPFQALSGDIVGTGNSVLFIDTTAPNPTRRFYRLEARVP